MRRIVFEAEAGQILAELAQRSFPSKNRVYLLIRVVPANKLQGMAVAEVGKGFDWLAEEPELCSDADLLEQRNKFALNQCVGSAHKAFLMARASSDQFAVVRAMSSRMPST